MPSKKTKKISTEPNTLIGKRLGTDTLLNDEGIGFEIQPLKHKHRTWIEAHSMASANEINGWTFRLGVIDYIGMDVKPKRDKVTDSLGREIEYLAEDELDNFSPSLIISVVEHIGDLSGFGQEDRQKLNFTLASKSTAKA